jgi:hypothetical protein
MRLLDRDHARRDFIIIAERRLVQSNISLRLSHNTNARACERDFVFTGCEAHFYASLTAQSPPLQRRLPDRRGAVDTFGDDLAID